MPNVFIQSNQLSSDRWCSLVWVSRIISHLLFSILFSPPIFMRFQLPFHPKFYIVKSFSNSLQLALTLNYPNIKKPQPLQVICQAFFGLAYWIFIIQSARALFCLLLSSLRQ